MSITLNEIQKAIATEPYEADVLFIHLPINGEYSDSTAMIGNTKANREIIKLALIGLDVEDKVRRCVELIEAERKPRMGILPYENACNHAINIIRRVFSIEGDKK